MNDIVQKLQSLPRAARWGIAGLSILLGYFVIVEPLVDQINRANTKADDRAGALISLTKDPAGGTDDAKLGVRKFGNIALPGEPETRSVAFNRRVSEILEKHKIKDNSTTRIMPLGAGPLKDIYGDTERIDRLVREVQFEATPEDIAAVISELEKTPEVAAVSRVQIRRGDQKDTAGRILKATISAEAWEIAEEGAWAMSVSVAMNLRALNSRLDVVGRIAAILLLLGAIVFLVSMRGLGRAVLAHSAKEAKQIQIEQMAKLVADYSSSVDTQVKQFNGRSVFFVPSPPIPPPPPVVDAPKVADDAPKTPPPPATYGGPKLIAMVNGIAWFDDGKKLASGSEGKDDLKIKELVPPWAAIVDWKGVEFKVSLFDRDNVIYPIKKPEPPKEIASADKPADPSKESPKDAAKEPPKETASPDVKASEKPAVEPVPDATKPDAPKPDEPKPETPKPEEPKPEAPKPAEPKQE